MRNAYYSNRPRRRAQVARDGRLRIGYQWWMLSRRGAGPPLDSVPPSSPCAAAAPGARQTDAQGAGHPCMRWPLSWRGQAADESSHWRSGVPAVTGPRWPPLVCGLLVFASSMPVSVEAPSARRPDCGKLPMLTRTTPGPRLHAEIPAWSGANLIHLRHKTRHPPHAPHAVSGKERPMPCPAKDQGRV